MPQKSKSNKSKSNKSKSSKSKSSFQMFGVMKTFFAGAFGAVGGYMAMMTVISLYTLLIAGSGYYLVKSNNKKSKDGKETPLFRDMTALQYFGALLMVLGLAPFMVYFFQAFMFSLGEQAGQAIGDEF